MTTTDLLRIWKFFKTQEAPVATQSQYVASADVFFFLCLPNNTAVFPRNFSKELTRQRNIKRILAFETHIKTFLLFILMQFSDFFPPQA